MGDTAPRFGLTNLTYRAHRYGTDYPGLQGKKLDSGELDLWNRLYGPHAFGLWARPYSRGMESASIAGERELVESKGAEVKVEPKPSVVTPGEQEVRSRLERLGY